MTATITVDLWWDPAISQRTRSLTVDAIDNLADELDTSATVWSRGEYSLDPDEDSYGEYLDEFETNGPSHVDGRQSLYLYHTFPDGDDPPDGTYPRLGVSRDMYRVDQPSYAMVNGYYKEHDWVAGLVVNPIAVTLVNDLHENVVQHELLHNMMEGGQDEDHARGAAPNAPWPYDSYGATTPMSTGYLEPVTTNDPPDDLCSGSTSTDAYSWHPSISSCTHSEAQWYLNYVYDLSICQNPQHPSCPVY